MLGHLSQREIETLSKNRAIAYCSDWVPDTGRSDTCACCIMLVCTHLLGSCHQQRHNKENGRCAKCARTALIARYALTTDFYYVHSLTLKFGSIQFTLSLPPSTTLWWVLALITDARAHCETCEQCACNRSLVYALSYVVCLCAGTVRPSVVSCILYQSTGTS